MNKGPNATICLFRRQNHAGTTVLLFLEKEAEIGGRVPINEKEVHCRKYLV